MHICTFCGKEISLEKFVSRKAACPKCGADLHICMNCRFYSETSHNRCIEPKAEFQRSREKANFCDYFVFSSRMSPQSDKREKEDVLKNLNDLFKK